MSRKVLLGLLSGALILTGCAASRKEPVPSRSISAAPAATPRAEQSKVPSNHKPRPSRSVSQKPQPGAPTINRADLPGLIGSGAAWSVPGQRMTINRGGAAPSQPVPLFRQAGTLASVRATLANSPAQPQAEFRNGVLTLKFDRGSDEDIAAAVNKTLSVTGSRNLQVTLQP